MEMVNHYLFIICVEKKEPLPFPEYLLPENRYVNDFWITQEGECYYPHQMIDRHLVNTVQLLHRNHPNFRNRYNKCDADVNILNGTKPWVTMTGKAISKNHPQRKEYLIMWKRNRIYMLLRRELKMRGLEKYL